MKRNNPEISQKFLEQIKNQLSEVIDIDRIKIKTCKNVFPPKSIFSHTSEKLYTIFGNLREKSVLDVGTGTGVQAIQAIADGANDAVALDINPAAVLCAKENVRLNNMQDRITVLESDLFTALEGSDKRFDVVIANLPITNFPVHGIVELSLYDPEYKIHRNFFMNVGNFLKKDGIIIMTHINFNGDSDFDELEEMLRGNGYATERFIEISDLGYSWRMYRICRKYIHGKK